MMATLIEDLQALTFDSYKVHRKVNKFKIIRLNFNFWYFHIFL